MPYYKKPNILFIHIPKTGGTVIENAIKKQYTQTLFCLSHLNGVLDPPFHNVTLQH